MLKLVDLISREVSQAFADAGYDSAYGKVTVSNRPDLCEYQCNGALPAAKVYHKAPMAIAGEVADKLAASDSFSMAEACRPGFLNLRLSEGCLAAYLEKMRTAERFGLEPVSEPRRMILDYGGPNVAKPLHVGHLRSAIIGESLKRIFRYFGHEVIGDIHMGDWGLQMGLIIAELRERQPELPYFDALRAEHPDDVAILAAHPSMIVDDPQAYLADKGYALSFATDTDGNMLWGIVGGSGTLPQSVVLNRRGEVIYNAVGSVTPELLEALYEEAAR